MERDLIRWPAPQIRHIMISKVAQVNKIMDFWTKSMGIPNLAKFWIPFIWSYRGKNIDCSEQVIVVFSLSHGECVSAGCSGRHRFFCHFDLDSTCCSVWDLSYHLYQPGKFSTYFLHFSLSAYDPKVCFVHNPSIFIRTLQNYFITSHTPHFFD